MQIVYHHRTQGTGAEGVHIAHVIKGLRELGHDVKVISPNHEEPTLTAGENPFAKKSGGLKKRALAALSRNLPQWGFEGLELGYNAQAYAELIRSLKRRPAFLYERHAFFLGAGAVASSQMKLPYFIEVNEIAGPERVRKQTFTGLAKQIERYVFSRADAIFVVSDFLKQQIANEGVASAKIHVVPNGVDEKLFDPDTVDKNVRQELGIEPDEVVFGFIGWFVAWHNLDLLIDAFADVAKGRRAKLLFLGDGDLRDAFQEQAERRGVGRQLLMPGARPYSEVPRYVNAMDVTIIPGSNAYRSPIKLFEYMAMQKPVVAPRLQPIYSVVDDHETALFFEQGDRETLRSTLSALLEDEALRRRLGHAARQKVLTHYLWRHNAQRVLDVYAALPRH